MFCPSCGTQNADEAKFCRGCGNVLGNSAANRVTAVADQLGATANFSQPQQRVSGPHRVADSSARSAYTLRESTDIISTAFNVVAVAALAFLSGAAREFVSNEYDAQVIAQVFSLPDWVGCLGRLGDVSVTIALCYLGLELGYMVAGCLSRRGLIAKTVRSSAMTALQWVSFIMFTAAFLAHIIVVLNCVYDCGQYPMPGSTNLGGAIDDDVNRDLIEWAFYYVVGVVCTCLVFRLKPYGEHLRHIRRVNDLVRSQPVVRWVLMCAFALIVPMTLILLFILAQVILAFGLTLFKVVVVLTAIKIFRIICPNGL